MAGIVAKHAQAAAPNDAAAMATSAGLDMMVEAAEAVGAEQEEINVADEDAVAGVMVAMIDDFATDDCEWEYDTDEEGGEGEVLEDLMELVTGNSDETHLHCEIGCDESRVSTSTTLRSD